ncbi:MAG: DUF4159 domain-containing protein [Planctomycetaceae bacterium]|jgi:hypothetical protein|nr:DUF4159 domain-containing protein [Planctomycetaceae bacterium]
MRKLLLLLLFSLLLLLFKFSPVYSQDIDPQQVRAAIEHGKQFLKTRQKEKGNWDEVSGQERCGATALVIIALISCGEPKNSSVIRKGMNYLRAFAGEKAGRNYSIALQTMAFCLVDPDKDRLLIRKNVELLERNQYHKSDSPHDGGWDYTANSGRTDLSNSQFSILALYEAERVGVLVKNDTWKRAYRYWRDTQNVGIPATGSWGYVPSPTGTGCTDQRGSMTCAGLASLIITAGVLERDSAVVRGEEIICFQKSEKLAADKLRNGFKWIADHFSVSKNPGVEGTYLYYYLYALERVGRMTNQRFIGAHDWYREGTDKLLNLRDKVDGSWREGTFIDSQTAMALLFLAKGRRPVLLAKMQYSDDDTWNLHQNDANNLTFHAERRWGLDLTWQIVDVRRATVDDLLQSPVLYFSGNNSPLPKTDDETKKLASNLRSYLDQGGFIMAEAQSNDRSFDAGFRELMRRVLPEPEYRLSLLERSHPIWSADELIEPDQIRPIEGINFGCRTSVVYLPPVRNAEGKIERPSVSCLLELAKIFQRDGNYPPIVQRQVDAGRGIALNILAYATNRELRTKDQMAHDIKNDAAGDNPRGRVFVSVLDHGGGASVAPRAVPNLLYWSESNMGIPVEAHTELVNPAGKKLFDYPFLFMHGRGKFQFSKQERDNLRKYLLSGGFLYVNSICSAKAFTESFQSEMKVIFAENPMIPIQADDELLSDKFGGRVIKSLELRVPERVPGKPMTVQKRSVEPELYGVKVNDRWVVVFSPNDISCSLESTGTLECRGYTKESALSLSVNILLYALEK